MYDTFSPGHPLDPGPGGLGSPLTPLVPSTPGIPAKPGVPQGPALPFSPLQPRQKTPEDVKKLKRARVKVKVCLFKVCIQSRELTLIKYSAFSYS